jgi:hypothetical protein
VEFVLPQISVKHAGQGTFKVNQNCNMNKNTYREIENNRSAHK